MASKSPLRKKRNFKNLTLEDSPVVLAAHSPSSSDSKTTPLSAVEAEYAALCEQLGDLEIGLELQLDLRPDDFKTLDELGRGNGGAVYKVLHERTSTIMARKIIHVEANINIRKQIMRELQFMHDCNSKHIVSFYGAFMNEGDISICMEFMEVGSLDNIYKKLGPIPLDVLKKITFAASDIAIMDHDSVVDGLSYLYDEHRIVHRDLKPSNVLVNSQGRIKLCDFGVSGQLINSVADTFVGTSSYMSPERIKGSPYSVKSDVWSLGIMLMELAMGRFPFPPDGDTSLSIFEMLQHIVNEPVPTFPEDSDKYPPPLVHFVGQCLIKDANTRATLGDLMTLEFLKSSMHEKVDLEKWAQSVLVSIR